MEENAIPDKHTEYEKTGYPSIDKPWLRYYSEEAINAPLPEMTMYEYAWENNKNDLSDIAFRYFNTKISYGEFFENAKRAARAFSAMGVKKDDIVTIMSMHTPEAIFALYGLNYIGAVANMVYMTLSGNEILHTLADTDSKMFLFLDAAAEKIETIRDQISTPIVMLSVADSMPIYMKAAYRLKTKKPKGYMDWKAFISSGNAAILPEMSTEHETMAVIVYTSGTTGEPKGVMLPDDALNALVFQDIKGIFEFKRRMTILFMIPPFVGFGISHLHLIIWAGMESILQIRIEPNVVTDSFYEYLPECLLTGPAYIDAIVHSNNRYVNLSNLKYFVGGGGEIPEEKEVEVNTFLKTNHSNAKYSNGYGMTEASSVLCSNCNGISKIGSAGIPFIKTLVKVIDNSTGDECKYGENGELHFSAPNLMLGYFKNDEATNNVVYTDINGERWIRTGDLGYVDEDGFVFLTGRIKRIYYTRSEDGVVYRLFPQKIEEKLMGEVSVYSCGVVVKEDAERINVAIAFVTLGDKDMSEEQQSMVRTNLFDLAARELPEHEQPADIRIIPTMPLTPSGKIDYRKLEEMANE